MQGTVCVMTHEMASESHGGLARTHCVASPPECLGRQVRVGLDPISDLCPVKLVLLACGPWRLVLSGGTSGDPNRSKVNHSEIVKVF